VATAAACVAGFAALTLLRLLLPSLSGRPGWQALHAHVANGLYVNTLANRLALRFWPSPSPYERAAAPSLLDPANHGARS
jgi:NAD(P)H-quinone oxidoreductase subunit 5